MRDEELIQIIATHHGLHPEQVRAYYQDEIEMCRAVVERCATVCERNAEAESTHVARDAVLRAASELRARGRVGDETIHRSAD